MTPRRIRRVRAGLPAPAPVSAYTRSIVDLEYAVAVTQARVRIAYLPALRRMLSVAAAMTGTVPSGR